MSSLCLAWLPLAGALSAAHAQPAPPIPAWLRPPRLAVMTGFLKDPEKPGTLDDWAAGVGAEFDAEALVGALTDGGVSYLIFYDKWHDGLVCHATRTTAYHTRRDLLRPVAEACERAGLPLVVYWNPCYDNNPDFAAFGTLDAQGRPILFPGPWPMRLLSVHSPFRVRAKDQLREIARDCGPISGLWLDCYSQPWPTADRFTTEAFAAQYGIAPDGATPEQAGEFVRTTLATYLAELRSVAREEQPEACFTINGSALAPLYSPLSAVELHSQLQFLSAEGHSLEVMDEQALAADLLARPMETGDLVSASWFAPTPPMAPGRARLALAEAAVAWCQGANVYLAIAPDYAGRFGEELEAVCAAGRWLQDRRALLAGGEPWPDVGIVLGAPAPTLAGWPALRDVWGLPLPDESAPWPSAADLLQRLHTLGYGGRVLGEIGELARWPSDLGRFRTLIVPERACLGPEHLARLRRYVASGGTLLAVGNGTRVEAGGALREDFGLADVLGLRSLGPAVFPPEARPVICYADSEYGHGWVRGNLVDGTEAGWASADSPMPHWAQVNLPVEAPVERVRVTSRRGGYLLRDFDVLTWNGAGWDLARTFAENVAPVAECVLDPPRTTLGVRVHVRAETAGGQDRDLADIEEIEVIAPDGAVLSHHRPYALEAGPAPSAGLTAAALQGPALVAEATQAEVLASFRDPQTAAPRPLLTRHRFGRGAALWFAAGEAGLLTGDWLAQVADVALGPPTLRCASDRARHRTILRRGPSGLVLCVIDRLPHLPAAPAELQLDLARTGLRGELAPVADAAAVRCEWDAGTLRLSITPDPAAVVLVR